MAQDMELMLDVNLSLLNQNKGKNKNALSVIILQLKENLQVYGFVKNVTKLFQEELIIWIE